MVRVSARCPRDAGRAGVLSSACGDGTGSSEQGRRNSLTTLRGGGLCRGGVVFVSEAVPWLQRF
eukprot:1780175-Prymnesium_polylepis.1